MLVLVSRLLKARTDGTQAYILVTKAMHQWNDYRRIAKTSSSL